jgi:hypothetical protein
MSDQNVIQSYINLTHIGPTEFSIIFILLVMVGTLLIYWVWEYILAHLAILADCWSLGFIATIVAAYWAISSGTLNNAGEPLNSAGTIVLSIAIATVDLNGDLYFIACFLCIVLGPQIMAYIILALFGCAANVHLFETATKFAAWSFIKTTATGSGIIIAFWLALRRSSALLDAIWADHKDYNILGSWFLAISSSLIFLYCSALATAIYSMVQVITGPTHKLRRFRGGTRASRLLTRIHAWATRHQSERDDDLLIFGLLRDVISAMRSLLTIYRTLKKAMGRAPTNAEFKKEWEKTVQSL